MGFFQKFSKVVKVIGKAIVAVAEVVSAIIDVVKIFKGRKKSTA